LAIVLSVIVTLVVLFAAGMYMLDRRDRHRPPEVQEAAVRSAFGRPQWGPKDASVDIVLSTISLERERVIEIGTECGYEYIGIKNVARNEPALEFRPVSQGHTP
jgi:hypothetical protein